MSDLSHIFTEGAKVVISPDTMRAWVSLPPPPAGVKYTAEAITEWLPQNGVVYGVDADMVRKAAASGRYDDLLEVARGKQPVPAQGGDYTLKIEKRPFTGLRTNSDGSLIYDDLSFLQEVTPGQVLAEIIPATPAENGITVTGEEVPPREGTAGRSLLGKGFEVSADGRTYTAPGLAHVNIVNDQLIVTPLTKLPALRPEDGEASYEGNVIIAGDVQPGSHISATGSIFVEGRAVAAHFKAGNNLLLCQGMRPGEGFGQVDAKGNVWGLFFEATNIRAGGDVCANHLVGCEVHADGYARVLGGRGLISGTTLYAKQGVIAARIGGDAGDNTIVSAGMGKELIDRYDSVNARMDRLAADIQATMQNITAHERVNRMKADKGKSDPAYKEMVSKRDKSVSVLNILTTERTRLKRSIDAFSQVNIIAREMACPGVEIRIDTRTLKVLEPIRKVKFSRNKEMIEYVEAGSK